LEWVGYGKVTSTSNFSLFEEVRNFVRSAKVLRGLGVYLVVEPISNALVLLIFSCLLAE
jgi:hypothetical protein